MAELGQSDHLVLTELGQDDHLDLANLGEIDHLGLANLGQSDHLGQSELFIFLGWAIWLWPNISLSEFVFAMSVIPLGPVNQSNVATSIYHLCVKVMEKPHIIMKTKIYRK